MKLNIKKLSLLPVVLFAVLMAISLVSALPVDILNVELDGRDLVAGKVSSFERDDAYEISVEFNVSPSLAASLEDVQVEARIRGYDQRDIIGDISSAFNAKPGVTYQEDLEIKLPVRLDQKQYKLRISIVDAQGDETTATYDLEVEGDDHAVWIKDIVLNPENEVQAGRALLTTVRLRNVGNEDEDDGIRVKVSVPSLGISATDYIDELLEDESVTSEELYMRIPQCAELGEHAVMVEVTYQDGDETEIAMTEIEVIDGALCNAGGNEPNVPADTKPVITAGVDVQNLVQGEGGAIYPITVTNMAGAASTFSISVDVENWAMARVSPSNVLVVQPGETKTAYVYLTANDNALPGNNLFAVTVKAGANTVEQFTMTANVVPGQNGNVAGGWDSVRKSLEIGLVVLVIILVILGLIIGLNKMRKSDEGDDEAQTYY